VEVGKRADFVLVADNPLTDVGNAASVSGVFSHGKWRSAPDLANMLMEAKALSADAE
jgi:imidazolonepropionase-like amidohydrolase